jgi:NADPH2:quinone reductase
MTSTYRAVMLTGKGGPKALDVLKVVALPVEEPGPGQVRVRVRAAGVGSTDFLVVGGSYRYGPKIPFVPGYEIAGVVDAMGPGRRSAPRRPAGRGADGVRRLRRDARA